MSEAKDFEFLQIDDNKPKKKKPVENILISSPADCWQEWVKLIANDPDMTKKRALAHLKKHIGKHFDEKRIEEWLAGCYNLLAIIGCMYKVNPDYLVGADLLYRKWILNPSDYTPPPKKKAKQVKPDNSNYYSSGS